ncbi:MAG: OsmC family protein [Pseudobdellovibrionaceae bacterium]
MVEMLGVYQGEKHCELSHGPSGTKISTDAPKDNAGRGEAFSPTDLVGAALASCILTTMAIVAERDGRDLKGAHFKVTKEMAANPRKIQKLTVALHLPAAFEAEYRKKMEHIALTCPVHRSLHPDVELPISFHWVL